MFWQKEIYRKVYQYGAYHTIFNEMRMADRENFFRYSRMSPEGFEALLRIVGPRITKEDTNFRQCVPPVERLAITLRYLATGDSQASLSFAFRRGRSTITNILRETCGEIWNMLSPIYLKAPSSTEDWRAIAEQFDERWNFPGCIGALDGKHIGIECPRNMGSAFYNYKNFHSVVLLAMCDAKYSFTMVDIGSFGRDNNAGIFQVYLGKFFVLLKGQ